jgi:hypothetical protein
MLSTKIRDALFLSAALLLTVLFLPAFVRAQAVLNPNPPQTTVKLIFIHHSTGENWLADVNGGLGIALRDNNYFVSNTNYGWGPDGIGDLTDIGHWWLWFRGQDRDTYLNALFVEGRRSGSFYSRLTADPGGENAVVMFKSCFPNSHLAGHPGDPPVSSPNPLRGEDCGSGAHTVANAKGIYNDLLVYFTSRQDKLFVVVTAPPLASGSTDAAHAANARALNDWLVNDWLRGYAHHNVAVFDFFNVLTSNGGGPNVNDSGRVKGNHHRFRSGAVEHSRTVDSDVSAYPTAPDDSHPTAAGNWKAADEFAALLNIAYHCWQGTGGCPRTVPVVRRTLTIAAGEGGTTVPTPGARRYNDGALVAIRAFPEEGFAFDRWEGDVAAGTERTNPLELFMDKDRTVRALFSRSLFPPLDFACKAVFNRSLSQRERIHVLSWRSHPANRGITAYRIYVGEETPVLLAEVDGETFAWLHRRVPEGVSQTYALAAVDGSGRESPRANIQFDTPS